MASDESDDESINEQKSLISQRAFSTARTFRDIIDRYLLYFEGKIPYLPTYFGELDPDTMAQLDMFKRINSLGLLTVNSQDGLIEDERNYEVIDNRTGEKIIYERIITKQRAYIDGYIEARIYEQFQKFISDTELLIFGVPVGTNKGVEFKREPYINVTSEETWINGEYQYRPYTNLHVCSTGDEWDDIMEWVSPKAKIPPLYYVQLLDPVWGRSNVLAETVIGALESIK